MDTYKNSSWCGSTIPVSKMKFFMTKFNGHKLLLLLQRTPSYMCHDILDLPLKSIDKSRWREYHPSSVFRFHWSYHIPSYFDQSVSGRNKCLCCSSHVLCYGCMWLCATHNSFASYDGNVIRACRANKADVSKPKHRVTWSHRTCINFPFLRGKESNT